jgi:histidine triad (HIT) family protein
MMDDCVFCKIVSGEIKGAKVLESSNFVVIRDVHPKTDGHSLVISKDHYDNFLKLPGVLYEEMMKVVRDAVDILVSESSATGFNLVINNGSSAGQVVNHFHLHILPRSNGDGFKVSV